jgi:hypothetical protein
MFQFGAEVILRMKCVSCLVEYCIGRSLEGLGFVLRQWEFRFTKTPVVVLALTGCGKSYYLLMPNTLKLPYVKDTFLSQCHISIHMNKFSHLQDGDSWSIVPKHHTVQQPKRRPSFDQ